MCFNSEISVFWGFHFLYKDNHIDEKMPHNKKAFQWKVNCQVWGWRLCVMNISGVSLRRGPSEYVWRYLYGLNMFGGGAEQGMSLYV